MLPAEHELRELFPPSPPGLRSRRRNRRCFSAAGASSPAETGALSSLPRSSGLRAPSPRFAAGEPGMRVSNATAGGNGGTDSRTTAFKTRTHPHVLSTRISSRARARPPPLWATATKARVKPLGIARASAELSAHLEAGPRRRRGAAAEEPGAPPAATSRLGRPFLRGLA